MRTQSRDTNPDIEQIQIHLLRQASLTRRFELVEAWSLFIRDVARQGVRREHPEASEQEVELILVARLYGQSMADRVRAYLVGRAQE